MPREPEPARYGVLDAENEEAGFVANMMFAEPADAAAYAKQLRAERGSGKFRVVRDVTDQEVWTAWQREYDRLRSGEYADLPEWFPRRPYHFPHWARDASRADQGWIAYTPTRLHAVQDRQVVLPASRYLARNFDDLSPDEISRLQQRLIAARQPTTFHITRDPAVVRDAYIDRRHCAESSDFPSCMRHGSGEYGLPEGRHPVDAYVGPTATLSLAYTKDTTGEIVARAIVAERSKRFVRVYGTDEARKRDLLDHLEARGFRRADDFAGERLHLEEHPRGNGAVVVPYLDGEAKWTDEEGTICFSDDAGAAVDCEVTCGWSVPNGYADEQCDRCGADGFAEDELTAVLVATSSMLGGNRYAAWCQCCVDDHALVCERSGREFDPETVDHGEVVIRLRPGYTEVWLQGYVDRNAFYCERTERYYSARAFTQLVVSTASGTETWCLEATEGEWRHDDAADEYLSVEDFPPDDAADAPALAA